MLLTCDKRDPINMCKYVIYTIKLGGGKMNNARLIECQTWQPLRGENV